MAEPGKIFEIVKIFPIADANTDKALFQGITDKTKFDEFIGTRRPLTMYGKEVEIQSNLATAADTNYGTSGVGVFQENFKNSRKPVLWYFGGVEFDPGVAYDTTKMSGYDSPIRDKINKACHDDAIAKINSLNVVRANLAGDGNAPTPWHEFLTERGMMPRKFFISSAGRDWRRITNNTTDTKQFFVYTVKIPLFFITIESSEAFTYRQPVATESAVTPNPEANTPSKINFATKTMGPYEYFQIRFGDIDTYVAMAARILQTLDERMKTYDMELNTPINMPYYVDMLKNLKALINGILQSNGAPSTVQSKSQLIIFQFKQGFSELEEMWYSVADPVTLEATGGQAIPPPNTVKPNPPGRGPGLVFDENLFKDERLNHLIFSLPAMYNEYALTQWNVQRFSTSGGAGGSTLISREGVRDFLKRYFIPAPTITTSGMTKSIIEKFLLGDARLIDDEYYKNYTNRTPADIGANFRANLNDEISQQYQKIGDFMGDKWISGEFKDINDINDLQKQLLDVIDIGTIVKIAAKCLLKLLPLDDLIDYICKGVLEKYDEYRDKIIQALENMDNGMAKDMAAELIQIGFKTLDEQAEYGGQMFANNITSLSSLIGDAIDSGLWSRGTGVLSFTSMMDDTTDGLKTILEAKYPGPSSPNSILERIQSLERRRTDMATRGGELQNRLGDFPPNNLPLNHKDTMDYYADKQFDLTETDTRLQKTSKNAEQQALLYSLLLPESEYFRAGENIVQTARSLLPTPNLHDDSKYGILLYMLALDPYITDHEKIERLYSYLGQDLFVQTADGLKEFQVKAITNLNAMGPDWFKNNATAAKFDLIAPFFNTQEYANAGFTFPPTYIAMPDSPQAGPPGTVIPEAGAKRHHFDLNTQTIQFIYKALGQLAKHDSAPFNLEKELKAFGAQTADAYFDEIFNSEKGKSKRRLLCLAIFAAVPAAIFMLQQLVKDPSPLVDIGTAIKRKVTMAFNFKFPVHNILDELTGALLQVAANFGRDLLINGIMYTLNQIAAACADDTETTNAPYSPVGAVDLSAFLASSSARKSQRGMNLGESESLQRFKRDLPVEITATQLSSILKSVSDGFTIVQMCTMLNDTEGASKHLFKKAIDILNSHDFIKGTPFQRKYANNQGIQNFFNLLSKDISPSLCAEAINNFNNQKSLLMEICLGRDDRVMKNILCKDKTPEECLGLLAAKAKLPGALAQKIVSDVDAMFGTNTMPDLCADTGGSLDNSQVYSADIIGDAIFGGIEKRFENDMSLIKNVYKDQTFGLQEVDMHSLMNQAYKTNDEKDPAVIKALQNLLEAKKSDKVALQILNNVFSSVQELPEFTRYKTIEDGHEKNIALDIKNPGIHRDISFRFIPDKEPYNTRLEVVSTAGDTSEFVNEGSSLALHTVKKFDFIEDTGLRSPDRILFGLFGDKDGSWSGVARSQPKYKPQLQSAINSYCMNTDAYMDLLNSIFKDLYMTSFKNDLFNKKQFNKLDFNKHFKSNRCFLGFLNKKALNRQTHQLAEKLMCYAPGSPTKTPVNVAIIKTALDSVIRIIAVKEIMKSLFVYGLVPTELSSDSERSFYDQFINSEIEKTLEKELVANNFDPEMVNTFITDIMKILYQDETLDSKTSFNLIKDSQVGFVKQQMIHTIAETDLSASANVLTEYQMVELALDGKSNDEKEPYSVFTEVSHVDQLQSLQNDYLSLYLHADSAVDDTATTSINWFKDADAPESILPFPQIQRNITKPLNFFDFNTLELKKSAIMGEVLQGIDDGIALERMIECKYNVNFLGGATGAPAEAGAGVITPQYGFILFLVGLGHSTILNNGDARIWLKRFFYETKLIMFFPQLKTIIDSLPSDEGVWKNYRDDKGNINLFAEMYKINFFPDYVSNSMSADLFLKDYAQENIDWTLGGKIYYSDFEKIIMSEDFLKLEPEDWEYSQAIYEKYSISEFSSNKKSTSLGKLYNHVINWLPEVETGANGEVVVASGQEATIESQKAAKTAFALMLTQPWIGGTDNFFTWFFKQSINDIITINSVFRLSSYISQKDALHFKESIFAGTSQGERQLMTKNLLDENIGAMYFLGHGEDGDINTSWDYLCFPLFENKLAIPNTLTWYDFFMALDGKSYTQDSWYESLFSLEPPWNINEVLFGGGEKKDVISYFHKLKAMSNMGAGKDNPFFLKKYQSTWWWNIRGEQVSREQILEHVLNNQFGGASGGGIPGTNLNFHTNTWGNDAFTYLDHSSLASLKEDASYFIDPATQELYCKPTDDIEQWFWPGKKAIYTPNNITHEQIASKEGWVAYNVPPNGYGLKIDRRYSWSPGGGDTANYQFDPASGVVVGTWDIKHPTSGKLLFKDAPKYIRITPMRWVDHDSNLDTPGVIGGDDNYGGTVNFGFWRRAPYTQGSYEHTGKSVDNIYPGAYSDPHVNWQKDGDYSNSEGNVFSPHKNAGHWYAFGGNGVKEAWLNTVDTLPGVLGGPCVWTKVIKVPTSTDPPVWVDQTVIDSDKCVKIKYSAALTNTEIYKYSLGSYVHEGSITPSGDADNQTAMDFETGHLAFVQGPAFGGVGKYPGWGRKQEIAIPLNNQINIYSLFAKTLNEADKELFELLLKSFFLREQTTIITILHKFLAEKYYPALDKAFNASIKGAADALKTAIASANGDYQHSTKDTSEQGTPDIDFGQVSFMILKMFIGAMANTFDPTWRTDWLMPGPLTPFGITAKLMGEVDFDDDDDGEPTPEPVCEQEYEKQIAFFQEQLKKLSEENK